MFSRLMPWMVAAAATVSAQPAWADVDPLPRSLTLQESVRAPRQEESPNRPATLTPAPGREDGPSHDFIDFKRVELEVAVGFASYSSDFESDPSAAGSLLLRAPLPWVSQGLLGLESDSVGAFLQATLTTIDREMNPPLEDPDGSVFLVTLGLDYTFLKDETFLVQAQAGAQFASFGGVSDTDDGFASVLGVRAGIQFAEGFWATVNPQISIGSRDYIFIANLGVQVSF